MDPRQHTVALSRLARQGREDQVAQLLRELPAARAPEPTVDFPRFFQGFWRFHWVLLGFWTVFLGFLEVFVGFRARFGWFS